MSTFPEIQLVPLSLENWRACSDLELAPEQRPFLPPNLDAIVEGRFFPKSRQVALVDPTGAVVGFAAYGEEEGSDRKKIFRFMIDRTRQRQGWGRGAMARIIAELFGAPGTEEIYLCYHPDNAPARDFYGRLGFREIRRLPCARTPEGKVEARLLRREWIPFALG